MNQAAAQYSRMNVTREKWMTVVRKAQEGGRLTRRETLHVDDGGSAVRRMFYVVRNSQSAILAILHRGCDGTYLVDQPPKVTPQLEEKTDNLFPSAEQEKTDNLFPIRAGKNFPRILRRLEERKRAALENIRLSRPDAFNLPDSTLVVNPSRPTYIPNLYAKWRDCPYDLELRFHYLTLYDHYDHARPITIDFTETTQKKALAHKQGADTYIRHRMSKAISAFHKEAGEQIGLHYVLEHPPGGKLHAHGIIGFNGSDSERHKKAIRAALRKVNKYQGDDTFKRFDVKIRTFKNDPEDLEHGPDYWLRYMSQDVPKKTMAQRVGAPITTLRLKQMTKRKYEAHRALYKAQHQEGDRLQ